MKSVLLVLLSLVMVVGIALAGCGEPTTEPASTQTPASSPASTPDQTQAPTSSPASTPDQTQAPTSAPTATEEWVPPVAGMQPGEEDIYIEWTYASAGPRQAPPPQFELTATERFYAAMEEATQGRFKVKYAYGILPAPKEMAPSVGSGLYEAGTTLPMHHPEEMALANIVELWGWNTSDLDQNVLLSQYVFTHPLVTASLDNMNLVYVGSGTADPFSIILRNGLDKIEKVEDLEGLQFGATGHRTLWASELGMVPVTVTMLDMYSFLEKGMVDAVGANAGMNSGMRYYEVIDYEINLDLGGPTGFEIVNKDAWESLPQYMKDLWWELVPTEFTEYSVEIARAQAEALANIYQEKGIESYSLAPEEEAKLEAALAPMWEAWVTETAQYPGGEGVVEFVKECMAYREEVTGRAPVYNP